MPQRPTLKKVGDATGEEADLARVQNRATLQAYYGKLQRHYDGIDQKIVGAQYFEDVNMLTGLKDAEGPELSELEVSKNAADEIDGKLADLKKQLDGRQLTRTAYLKQLKSVQSEAFARKDLSLDEKTYAYAKTAQASAAQTYQELSGKKHRKLREVKGKLMPAEKRRARLEQRRPTGVQPRYFRAGASLSLRNPTDGAAGQAAATAAAARPVATQVPGGATFKAGALDAKLPAQTLGGERPTQARTAASLPQAGARRPAGAGARGTAAGRGNRAARGNASGPSRGRTGARALQADEILAKLDPNLSTAERCSRPKS